MAKKAMTIRELHIEDEPINEQGTNIKRLTDLVGAKENEALFRFDDDESESSLAWSPKRNSDKVDEQATDEAASNNESAKQKPSSVENKVTPIDDNGEKSNKKQKSKKKSIRPKQSKKQSQILLSIGDISSSSQSESANDLKEDIKEVKSHENKEEDEVDEKMSASSEKEKIEINQKESNSDKMEEEYLHKPRKTSYVQKLQEAKKDLKKTDRSSELLRPKKDNHQKLNDVESDDAKLEKIAEEIKEKSEKREPVYNHFEKRKEIEKNGYLIPSNCKAYNHAYLLKTGIFMQDLVIDNFNFYKHKRLWYFFSKVSDRENLIQITVKYGACHYRQPSVVRVKIVSLTLLSKILEENYNLPTIWELNTSEKLVTTVNLNLFVMFLKKLF